MSIEIKQLVIKSTIDDNDDEDDRDTSVNASALKQDVLGECRRLVMELLADKGLR
ncbi:MAG: DUF5908 family protein [Gammaproteobacteria bacterium]